MFHNKLNNFFWKVSKQAKSCFYRRAVTSRCWTRSSDYTKFSRASHSTTSNTDWTGCHSNRCWTHTHCLRTTTSHWRCQEQERFRKVL